MTTFISKRLMKRLLRSVPVGDLDEQLTGQRLAKISKSLLDWQFKGCNLGLTEGEMEDIREDYKNSNEMQKVAMLRRWAKINGPQATLRNLIEVSCQNGLDKFARDVCVSLGYISKQNDCTYGAICIFIVILILTGVGILYHHASIAKIMYKPFSPVFPSPNRYFVGRCQNVSTILKWLDFSSNASKDIVNIVGPPGMGKSALAIYVGNEVITRGESAYYINMAEFPNEQLKQVLAAKIFSLWNRESNLTRISFDRLRIWANRLWFNTVIILDNCDDCIQNQLEDFHEAVKELLEFSRCKIKIITSSREILLHLENYATFKVQPLDEDSAYLLLESKVPHLLNFTEKKAIADLTGEVPLALQIIGALLSVGINPPTPSEIITNLKSRPISTLSPTGLHRNMQLNASISLSYDFLDQTTQKTGYYLTVFPGSFDKETAVEVLSRICTDDVHQTLNSLIARSLLEFDDSTGRCSYHRLIKSFFMTKQHPLHFEDFHLAFLHFFDKRIQDLVNEYYYNPSKALVMLNLEQHNILYFVELLQNKLYLYPPEDYASFVTTYNNIYQYGYLHLRLTSTNLIEVTNTIIDNIEKYICGDRQHLIPVFFKLYVNLVIGLCIERHYKDTESALNECKKRIPFVEKVKYLPGTTEEYVHFYYLILSFKELVHEQTLKLYHARLLSKINKSNLDCMVSTSETTCEYYHFASSYYYLADYEKSADFLEKALVENNPSVLDSLLYLSRLRVSYLMLGNTSKRVEVEGKLLDLFDTIIDQPSSRVHIYLSRYYTYFTILGLVGETEKAITVYEKIFNSMKELGSCGFYRSYVQVTLDITEYLLKLKEFLRVVEFVDNILNCIDFSNHQEYLKFSLYKNKALFLFGKFADAQKQFEDMMKFIIKNNLTESYSLEYNEVCYYLFKSRNFDYFFECYYDKVINGFSLNMHRIYYAIFVTIYDLYLEDSSSGIVRDQPVDNYPPVIELSKETSLSHNDFNEGTLSRAIRTSYFHVVTDASSHFKHFLSTLTSYSLFRFLANLLSIVFRLSLCFYLCGVFLRSIRLIFRICYFLVFSLYFMLFIVLAYCYTYFEKYIF